MHVISPNIDCSQHISSICAYFADGPFNHWPVPGIEFYGRMFQLFDLRSLQARIGCYPWGAILILFATHRTALIAVQPSAISSKRDEICEREFVIIKVSYHGLLVSPSPP